MITNNIKTIPRQRGAALITALMFLIIMTMLALTSMGTNTLEERMASNSQQINRSFQAAEAGAKLMLDLDTALDNTSGSTTSTTVIDFGISNDITLTYAISYQQETPIARGPTASDQGNAFHHFDITGSAMSGGVSTAIHSGVYKSGPAL